MNTSLVRGVCDPRFTSVADLLAASVAAVAEVGGGFAVFFGGTPVVDLTFGTVDVAGAPFRPESLALSFSTGKPLAALAALSVVADGILGLDAPVAAVWPEFGAAGKDLVTLRDVLCHRSGVWAFPASAAMLEPLDRSALVDALAAAPPMDRPGRGLGEHALTYGHLLDEIVRRATGQALDVRFSMIAARFGWDLHLSLGDAELPRAAGLAVLDPAWADLAVPGSPGALALSRPRGVLDVALLGSAAWQRSTFAAISLQATARSLADFYSDLLDPDGRVAGLLGAALHREYVTVQASGLDAVLGRDVSWTLGFQRDADQIGMGGIGGSAAWASTALGYSAAYVTRGLARHDRVDAVADEVERILAAG